MNIGADFINLSGEQCSRALCEYEDLWSYDGSVGDFLTKIENHLNLPENLPQQDIFEIFKREESTVNNLKDRLEKLGEFTVGDEDLTDLGKQITRIKYAIGMTKHMICFAHNTKEHQQEEINKNTSWSILGQMDDYANKKDKVDANTVKRWLTVQCKLRNYKRCNGCCYEQIQINGHKTPAYKEVKSISDFVMDEFPKTHPYWEIVAKSSHRDDIIKYFEKYPDPEDFPDLKKNRHIYVFNNGTWITKLVSKKISDQFYPHGEPLPAEYRGFAASKYFDQDFVDPHEGVEDGDWFDIIKTHCPNMKKIMDTQEWEEEVQRWFVIMICRCIYERGDLDNWQVDAYQLGIAGTGKSTVINYIIEKFFSPEDVGSISNNCEKKFALQAVWDKFILVCSEVKRDFCLEQAQWQQMMSGESITFSIKHEPPKTVSRWKVSGIYAGNETPEYSDNSGAVSRRLLIFKYDKMIDPSKADDRLPEKLEKEVPYILLSGVRGYLDKICRRQNNIWNMVPAYFKEQRNNLASNTHALQAYMEDKEKSGEFTFKTVRPDEYKNEKVYYIKPADFKKDFMDWCRASGKQVPNWNRDYYNVVFMKKGIFESPTRLRRAWPPNNAIKKTLSVWYYGFAYSEYIEEEL